MNLVYPSNKKKIIAEPISSGSSSSEDDNGDVQMKDSLKNSNKFQVLRIESPSKIPDITATEKNITVSHTVVENPTTNNQSTEIFSHENQNVTDNGAMNEDVSESERDSDQEKTNFTNDNTNTGHKVRKSMRLEKKANNLSSKKSKKTRQMEKKLKEKAVKEAKRARREEKINQVRNQSNLKSTKPQDESQAEEEDSFDP